jgi:cold shock protein
LKRWLIATVRQWSDDEGWGVVSVDEIPDDVWVHFSAIQIEGYKSLKPGERIEVRVEGPLPFDQDGYRYRATAARRI